MLGISGQNGCVCTKECKIREMNEGIRGVSKRPNVVAVMSNHYRETFRLSFTKITLVYIER